MRGNSKRFYKRFILEPVTADQHGSTVIEIVTVVVLFGILMAVAVPNYSKWAENRQLNAESQKLYLNLMLARSSAIKNNNDVLFTFNAGANTYKIHDDTDSDGVEDSGETVKLVVQDPKVQFGFVGSSIIDIDGNTDNTSVALVGGGSVITFDSSGQASTGGSAYLIHANDVGESNDRLRTVSIVEATGAVDLWKYQHGQSPPWS
ncbi:MAG: hypothetical protein NPINA01_19580 [Nitrospinaceae bacterium]|nr:MAG: hypothetical protein NPINA01_19580 [Nitrospinaceae bacterium]